MKKKRKNGEKARRCWNCFLGLGISFLLPSSGFFFFFFASVTLPSLTKQFSFMFLSTEEEYLWCSFSHFFSILHSFSCFSLPHTLHFSFWIVDNRMWMIHTRLLFIILLLFDEETKNPPSLRFSKFSLSGSFIFLFFLFLFSYITILILNSGQSNVKDSYSPPSPQTFSWYFSFSWRKTLCSCERDFPRWDGLSPSAATC